MGLLAALLLGLSTLYVVTGFIAVARMTRARRDDGAAELPPITVLKPLKGADDDLEANLRSFFSQDYPVYQIVFGVEDESDPAVEVVRRLRAEYRHVDSALVIHSGRNAANPKVSNLRGMLPHAAHDRLLISDSNIAAPPDYLRDLAATAATEGTGIVTNLFAGVGESTLGAALENAQVNGFVATGAALPMQMGDPIVIGKSMFFSRRVFERLGGFASVSDVLAEDYMIGKMFQHAGYGVRMGRVVLGNVTRRASVEAFIRRHLRWLTMRARLHPVAYVLEPLSSPLALLPVAVLALGPVGLAWALSMVAIRDVGQWILLRGSRRCWLPLLLAPIKEACMLAAWMSAPFVRSIAWRGHRVRVGAGTRVFVPEGALALGPEPPTVLVER